MIQPSSARALTRRIWQVLFAAVLVVETTGCKKEAPTQKQPVVRPVRVQRVAPSGGAEQRTFAGTARAAAESRLSFKVAGTLERLTVKVGDRVLANHSGHRSHAIQRAAGLIVVKHDRIDSLDAAFVVIGWDFKALAS